MSKPPDAYTSADEALRNAITLSGGATVDVFAAEIRAHLAEAGYKILPREPTETMEVALDQTGANLSMWHAAWDAGR